jgi:hypothetical protein
MPGHDLFLVFTLPLEASGLAYMVTGSVASIVYGEPRMTHDIDLVLDLKPADASLITAAFASDAFYCPPEEAIRIEASREQRGHFNLIHLDSGFKADVYLKGNHPLHIWAFARRQAIELGGNKLWVAPPEYVVIRKLEFHKEGGSDKHIRDVIGILELSGDNLDRTALEKWIARLGLEEEWRQVDSHL